MAMPTRSRDDDDDGGDAYIGSTSANATATATATADADAADVAAAGGVASCSIKRLSATLVGGVNAVRGVASGPDQRLLMTRRRERRQKKSQAMDAMMQSRWSAC